MSKSTLHIVSEGVAWSSVTSALTKVIGILYTIVVLSSITVAEFGLVELAMSVIPLLSVFSLAGLQPVIIADLVVHKTEKQFSHMRRLFSAYVSIRVLLGIAAFGLLQTAIIFSDQWFEKDVLLLVQVLSFIFVTGPIRAALLVVFNTAYAFKTLAQFRLLEEVCKLGLVIVFLLMYELGPLGVVLAFVLTEVLITTLFVCVSVSMAKKAFPEGVWSLAGLKDPFLVVRGHGKWSVMQSSLHQVGQNIRPWIIQFFLGTTAVGLYAAASGIYQHAQSLAPIARILSPVIPKYVKRPELLTRVLFSGVKYQIVLLFCVVVGSLLVLPWLVDAYFESYAGAITLFAALAVSFVPDTFSRVYEAAFHAFKLQRSLFVANIVKLCMICIVLPPAIMWFGIYGVAIEFFLTQAMYAWSRYRVLHKQIPSFSFLWRDLVRFTDTDKMIWQRIRNWNNMRRQKRSES